MNKVVKREPIQDIDPETFEFKEVKDFEIFNRWARKNGHAIRVPDESYYKKVKVKFQRFDQPENLLKTRVRNKDIDWRGELIPGQIYELATPVVKFLNRIAEPIYGEVAVNDGSSTKTRTEQIGERSKFSCQVIEFED